MKQISIIIDILINKHIHFNYYFDENRHIIKSEYIDFFINIEIDEKELFFYFESKGLKVYNNSKDNFNKLILELKSYMYNRKNN